jgi:mxaL protein
MRGVVARVRDALDLRLLLLLLAALCALLALQDPRVVLSRPVYRYVFVLDVTESMNVADAEPAEAPVTRIAQARQAVAAALEHLGCGSEAGLAIFAERRALLLFAPVEICANYGTVVSMLDRVDWRLAWRGGSEIAHGLDSGMQIVRALGRDTRLVFLTDGHEAPPVHPELRMHFDEDAGMASGLIVGIGGDRAVPIPVLEEDGTQSGWWKADQVQQVDSYSLGRRGSENSEPMTGVDSTNLSTRIAQGTEHLSSLHESYLRELAREAQLDYQRLHAPADLGPMLAQARYAHSQAVSTSLRTPLALAALVFLVAAFGAPLPARLAIGRGHARFLRDSSHSRRDAGEAL